MVTKEYDEVSMDDRCQRETDDSDNQRVLMVSEKRSDCNIIHQMMFYDKRQKSREFPRNSHTTGDL